MSNVITKAKEAGLEIGPTLRLGANMHMKDMISGVMELDERLTDSNPARAEIKRNLVAAMNADPSIISKINDQLKQNPSLKGDILSLIEKNPAALNAKLPDLIKNPALASTVVAGLTGKVASVAAVATPAAPAGPVQPLTTDEYAKFIAEVRKDMTPVNPLSPVMPPAPVFPAAAPVVNTGISPVAAVSGPATSNPFDEGRSGIFSKRAVDEIRKDPGFKALEKSLLKNEGLSAMIRDTYKGLDNSGDHALTKQFAAWEERSPGFLTRLSYLVDQDPTKAGEHLKKMMTEGSAGFEAVADDLEKGGEYVAAGALSTLVNAKGFDGFMQRVEKDNALRLSLYQALSGEGKDKKSSDLLEKLAAEVHENPNFMESVNGSIDEAGNSVSTFAETLINNPDMTLIGMKMKSKFDGFKNTAMNIASIFGGGLPGIFMQVFSWLGEKMMGAFSSIASFPGMSTLMNVLTKGVDAVNYLKDGIKEGTVISVSSAAPGQRPMDALGVEGVTNDLERGLLPVGPKAGEQLAAKTPGRDPNLEQNPLLNPALNGMPT